MEGQYAEPSLEISPDGYSDVQLEHSNYVDSSSVVSNGDINSSNYVEPEIIELNERLVEQSCLGAYVDDTELKENSVVPNAAATNYEYAAIGSNYADVESDVLEYGEVVGVGGYVDEEREVDKNKKKSSSSPSPSPNPNNNNNSNNNNNNLREWLQEFWSAPNEEQSRRVMNEFREISMAISKKIVEEKDLEDFAKTVKPLPGAKGVAGGVKYVKDGIFFKFSTDFHGIYGGDEFSSKAASQELLGQQHVLHWIKSLSSSSSGSNDSSSAVSIPLMTVCDVRGYRVVATSLLPLGKVDGVSSLKYGSDDGGETVHSSDAVANQLMANAGKYLNLKPHIVGKNLALIHFPADIECHAGNDGRYYIIDTARLWCPEAPSFVFLALLLLPSGALSEIELPYRNYMEKVTELVGGGEVESCPFGGGKVCFQKHGGEEENAIASSLARKQARGRAIILPDGIQGKRLYMLLRPELIRTFPTPLSPDAFTAFASRDPDRLEHEREVRSAFAAVLQQRIPALAADIEANRVALVPGLVSNLLHQRGINVRHMALLRAQFPEVCVRPRKVLLVEMIARSFKVIVRSVLRSSQNLTEHEVYANYLNLLLGNSDASKTLWNISLRLQLSYKFGHYNVCVVATDASLFDLRDAELPWDELLRSVFQQLHLSYAASAAVQRNHVFVKEGFSGTVVRARCTMDLFSAEAIDAQARVAAIDKMIDEGNLRDAYGQIVELRELLGVNQQCPLWVVLLNLACKILVKIGRHDATIGKDFAQAFAYAIRAMRMEKLQESLRTALFGQSVPSGIVLFRDIMFRFKDQETAKFFEGSLPLRSSVGIESSLFRALPAQHQQQDEDFVKSVMSVASRPDILIRFDFVFPDFDRLHAAPLANLQIDNDGCVFRIGANPQSFPKFNIQSVREVVCGEGFVVALTGNGRVFSAGTNQAGQLGLGDVNPRPELNLVAALPQSDVVQIACTPPGECQQVHVLALGANGVVFAWGSGKFRQLGVGPVERQLVPRVVSPLQGTPISRVACGEGFSLAISRKDLSLLLWGEKIAGCAEVPKVVAQRVHDLSASHSFFAFCTQGDGLALVAYQDGRPPAQLHQLGKERIVTVACGSAHVLWLSDTGKTFAMGPNVYGQLALFDDGPSEVPITPSFVWYQVPTRQRAVAIRAGANQSSILLQDGSLVVFGRTFGVIPKTVASSVSITGFVVGAGALWWNSPGLPALVNGNNNNDVPKVVSSRFRLASTKEVAIFGQSLELLFERPIDTCSFPACIRCGPQVIGEIDVGVASGKLEWKIAFLGKGAVNNVPFTLDLKLPNGLVSVAKIDNLPRKGHSSFAQLQFVDQDGVTPLPNGFVVLPGQCFGVKWSRGVSDGVLRGDTLRWHDATTGEEVKLLSVYMVPDVKEGIWMVTHKAALPRTISFTVRFHQAMPFAMVGASTATSLLFPSAADCKAQGVKVALAPSALRKAAAQKQEASLSTQDRLTIEQAVARLSSETSSNKRVKMLESLLPLLPQALTCDQVLVLAGAVSSSWTFKETAILTLWPRASDKQNKLNLINSCPWKGSKRTEFEAKLQ